MRQNASLLTAPPASPVKLLTTLLRPALLLCGLLSAALLLRALPDLRHLLLSGLLSRDGWRGWAVFLCVGTAIGAVGLPRQAVGFAGGFAYGPLGGILIASAANLAAALVDLLWARLVAGDWARRRLAQGRMGRLDGFMNANPFTAILTLRLLPVGSSLMVSLLAGLLGVRLAPFLTATLIGSLPQTVVFVLIGSGARIGYGLQIGLGIGLFAASGLGGVLLFHRSRVAMAASSDKI
ncbi:TVP38/TMEM64 family protein [Lichenicoccus sp.]|uniref:TVP38/TMEM64 family protein n=1 Tax=Lichenicoccus sp. TaxID=2781899 RepID=UPI003D14AD7F